MKKLFTIAVLITLISCENKKECSYITMKPGDTIIYRYPNIPKILRTNNAKINNYYSKLDSVIVTYNYENNNCE
jgi:hypothetical protein